MRDVRRQADGRPRTLLRQGCRWRRPVEETAAAVPAAWLAPLATRPESRVAACATGWPRLARPAWMRRTMMSTRTRTAGSVLLARKRHRRGHDRNRDPSAAGRATRRRPRHQPFDECDLKTHDAVTFRQSSISVWRGCISRWGRAACAEPEAAACRQRRICGRRAERCTATRSATGCVARRWRGAAKSRSNGTSARCSPGKRCGASCSASRDPAPTSPACRHAACATVTNGTSTVRRCGRRWPTCRGSGCWSCAPTPRPSSTPD